MSATLLEQEAHVWQVSPESIRDSAVLADFRTVLSDEERKQCDRFHFPEDGHRYLVSHAMLRHVLSGYTGLAPTDLLFSRSAHGRPEIGNSEVPGIRFNLTHTRGLAACIVTRNNDCGIDAEKLDSRHNMTGIAQRMFSAEECHQLEPLRGAELSEAFFSRWVLREAFVKAKGIGISYPTRKLHFDIRDDNTIRAGFDPDLGEDERDWQFRLLRPTGEHITAIALRRDRPADYRVVQHAFKRWPDSRSW
jgi:4'-phosphopantetheinyl transferase